VVKVHLINNRFKCTTVIETL